MDVSFDMQIIRETICAEAAIIRDAWTRPSVLLRPEIFPDGAMWCALLGKDLQVGVAGFGKTPAEAAEAFDKAWASQLTPTAQRRKIAEEEAHEEALANSQFGAGA